MARHATARFRRAYALAAALSLACAAPAPAFGQGLFTHSWASANAVSQNGRVVVGAAADAGHGGAERAFRFTESDGFVNLGALTTTPFTFSNAKAVNADGSVVVGYSFDAQGGEMLAFRWTQSGGMQSLGSLPGATGGAANGVNHSGDVVVGGAGINRAFRWTQATGMVDLGMLPGYDSATAFAVNASGSVVVGQMVEAGSGGLRSQAFRWTESAGMAGLGQLNGGPWAMAASVSASGDVVVGQAADGAVGNATRAFRWTQGSGMVSLGTLSGNTGGSWASSVSGNGLVVVGSSNDRGFRWTEQTGMITVEDWLRSHGVVILADVTRSANGTDANGDVVVGMLQNGQAYIARGVGQGAASGLISFNALQQSLAASAPVGHRAASGSSDLVLHGAHSFPVRQLVAPSRNCAWVQGDIGRDTHNESNGDIGLAEIGACRRLSEATQIQISLGTAWNNQDLVDGGSAEFSGAYLLPEVLFNLSSAHRLWATFSALLQSGDIEIRRNYQTASGISSSTGRPDASAYALRARVDWLDAMRAAQWAFTPYGQLSYASTEVDGYTETGGSFPAVWEKTTARATTGRLGLNATRPMGARTTFLAGIEAAYVVDESGSSSRGEVVGSLPFDVPRESGDKSWGRVVAGVESRIGEGKLTALVNATSRGNAPAWWLNVGYQLEF